MLSRNRIKSAGSVALALLLVSCLQDQADRDGRTRASTTSALVPGSPTWSDARAMSVARAQHAAVLLGTGKLLVVNGVNRTGFVATAELYDPANDTWTSAGSPGVTGNVTASVLLPDGRAFVLSDGARSAALYHPSTNAWSMTANEMAAPRSLSTLTLLASGKVLIAGGSNLSSAELFDPTTNSFAPTGSMSRVHRAHVSTLLRDGRVLAVSGFNNVDGEVPSAEIYNPAAGTWSLAAPPLVPRHYATGTLLPDGRVLLVGGFTSGGVTTHAELYDPTANTWTATGSLAFVRNGHAASLLPTGRVLVFGGADGARNAQAVAEWYDPATGLWTSTDALAVARENGTATLLPSGKVLFAGGYSSNPSLTFYNQVEIYDPAASAWTSAGALGSVRTDPAAALLPSGKVLVAGGRNANGTSATTAALYDRATNGWASTSPLATARERATATVLRSGTVLVVGGTSNGTTIGSTERFNPATSTWSAGAAAAPRHFHAATLLATGNVLVTGGQNGSSVIGSPQVYNPTTNAWTAGGTASARSAHAAALLPNGKVLVAGGRNGAGVSLASAEVYDATTNSWSGAASMGQARAAFTLTVLPSGHVLATGGWANGAGISSTEVFDPASNTWAPAGTLTEARFGHTATLTPSGRVLVAGGGSASGVLSDSAESYDPGLRIWSPVANPVARGGIVAVALPSGETLIAGGTGARTAELYDDARAQAAWRPVVTSPDALFQSCPSVLAGQRFRGISGASGGAFADSTSNFPLVRLRAAEGGRLWTLPATGMSATSATVTVPATITPGIYALSVFANAISGGRMVRVAQNTAPVAQNKAVTTTYQKATPITVMATDADAGQTLTWTVVKPPAHGTLSGSLPSVTYTPAAAYIGPDSFTYRTRDCGLDSNVATVSITVVDPSPIITCPENGELEATSSSGATAAWMPATVTDVGPPAVSTIMYAPALGSTLPLGSTTVTASVTDGSGTLASCVFQVVVKDTTPPTVSCPSNQMATSTNGVDAVVPFELAAATDTVSTPTVSSIPASGSAFPIGTTPVTVTGIDGAGNSATCQFEVTVLAPSNGPDPGEGKSDAGPSETGDAGPDPTEDSGTPNESGDDAGAPSPDDATGCSCRSTGGELPSSPRTALAVGLAALMSLGRRRRR